jgi:hypothetical protein
MKKCPFFTIPSLLSSFEVLPMLFDFAYLFGGGLKSRQFCFEGVGKDFILLHWRNKSGRKVSFVAISALSI